MTNNKKCKTKDCTNPVLERSYCDNCTKIKEEERDKSLIGASIIIGGIVGIYTLSKVVLKFVIKK